jgi:hypothetical protein
MKGRLFFCFYFFVIVLLAYVQTPPAWWVNPPPDTDWEKYVASVSEPAGTIQAAVSDARRDAAISLAEKVSSFVHDRTEMSIRTQGDLLNPVLDVRKDSSLVSRLELNNIKEVRREIMERDGNYIAYLLVKIAAEDLRAAREYARHEKEAFDIYNLFSNKVAGLSFRGIAEAPQGFHDYSSWLEHSCLIISITGDERDAFLDQTAVFLGKAYGKIVMVQAILDGTPVLLVYDAPSYGEEITRIIRQGGHFTVTQKNYRLALDPLVPLRAFRKFAESQKDASKILIAGIERIQPGGEKINGDKVLESEFMHLASADLGMKPSSFSLSGWTPAGSDESAVIASVRQGAGNFPGRYILVYFAESCIEPGIPAYRIPQSMIANCRVVLYDLLLGRTFRSKTVNSGGFVSISDRMGQDFHNEGLRALGFFRSGTKLKELMEEVFAQL